MSHYHHQIVSLLLFVITERAVTYCNCLSTKFPEIAGKLNQHDSWQMHILSIHCKYLDCWYY